MTNIDRYNTFISSLPETWKSKLTWQGLDGQHAKHSISIIKFEKNTNAFDSLAPVMNAKSFFKVINKLADTYVKWCCSQNIYSDYECVELRNFFVGTIGEYFFTFLINDVKCMLIKNYNTNMLERYDFCNVCPRLPKEDDYGIDLTGMVSYNKKYYPCAFQVKFWNPDTDTPITNKIASSAYADAMVNNFIEKDDKKNIIVCWLGDTKNVSKYLKANTKLYEHIGFIDMYALDTSINNTMPNFWHNLYEELKKIGTF